MCGEEGDSLASAINKDSDVHFIQQLLGIYPTYRNRQSQVSLQQHKTGSKVLMSRG